MHNKISVHLTILFRFGISIIIIYQIITMEYSCQWMQTAFVCGMIGLILNDWLRYYLMKYQSGIIYDISIALSIIGAGFYAFWLNSLPVSIYYLFPLIELSIKNKRALYLLYPLHMSVFVITNYLLKDLSIKNLVIYISIVAVIWLFKKNEEEKRQVTILNQELMRANKQLKEYAENAEYIAMIKERTRIAQEMHDSIGHGLVALSMHLEFIQKMLGNDKEKACTAAAKAYALSLKCLQDLRSAVSILKEEKTKNGLMASIKEIMNNFDQSGSKILLNMDDQVEEVTVEIKDCIYKTVREAISNSIKSGNAKIIQIEIAKKDQMLTVMIKDDGNGCDHIMKSHGLLGIEERAEKLGGNVQYESQKGRGFLLKMEIPDENRKEY